MKPDASSTDMSRNAADNDESAAATLAAHCIAALRPGDRVSKDLDIMLESTGPGRTELSMTVKESMINAYEICHGGYIFTLADTAFAYAASTRNKVAVGLNCHIDYLRPALKGDRLRAYAEITSSGKRTGVGDATVVDQNGRTIAQMRGRYYDLDQAIVDGNGEKLGGTSAGSK
jgi:acyl-CoA thioesterase